jgi:hypothetical protein
MTTAAPMLGDHRSIIDYKGKKYGKEKTLF